MKNRLWKNWFLILLGVFVMALPWTGFPGDIKRWLFAGAGLCVVFLSFSMAQNSSREPQTFTQDLPETHSFDEQTEE